MLHYIVVFLIIALIASILGFGALAGAALYLARICLLIFLVLFVLMLLRRKRL